jgi:hypothetical protein
MLTFMASFWFCFLLLHHFAMSEFLWVLDGVQLLDKEEPGALLAPYEKVKAWMVAVEEFTAPYFVDAHGVLEKVAKIFEDRRKSEAEAEVETAPKL